jgi:hypothetical protein
MGGSGGGGLLGGMTESLFGDGGAGAAGDAAMAQQRMANQAFKKVTSIADAATVSGLANFDKALASQEKNLARQEQMVSKIDPTIIEASQQALRLLRGESASTLKPLNDQRSMQRQKLVNSLREQLGPGAETSTAGIQALTRFDSETGQLTSGAQQQALSNVGNIFGQFSAGNPNIDASIGNFANLAQGRSGLQMQQANMYQQAYAPMLQTAGAQYTSDVMRGQQSSAFGQQLFGAALQGGMAYATGGLSMGIQPKKEE